MFCNGSWLDKGELARPRVATITGRTSSVDDIIRPISCPPIPKVVHALDGHRNMKRFAYYCIDAHI